MKRLGLTSVGLILMGCPAAGRPGAGTSGASAGESDSGAAGFTEAAFEPASHEAADQPNVPNTAGSSGAVEPGTPELACTEEGAIEPCGPESSVGICRMGERTCNGGEWSRCEGSVAPATSELCDDLRDDNCNGLINEGCDRAMVATGGSHACHLRSDGTVLCFGINMFGILGVGDTVSRGDHEVPTTLVGLGDERAKYIAAGSAHTCGAMDNGSLRCWGNNAFGQLGNTDDNRDNIGDNELPISRAAVTFASPVVHVAAGGLHTCVVLENGDVSCFGDNRRGQLGASGATGTRWQGPLAAAQVATGDHHTCVLSREGGVRCFGANDNGQCGNGTLIDVIENPLDVPELNLGARAVQVAAGSVHTCAVLETGSVRCWGQNSWGQLGFDAPIAPLSERIVDASLTRDITFDSGITHVALGVAQTCVRLANGHVRCWGQGNVGQLGNGYTGTLAEAARTHDIDLGSDRRANMIDVGNQHACVLTHTSDYLCWGLNNYGQLGRGHINTIGDDETPSSAGNLAI